MSKYEKVDLGNVRGKTGEKGQDGIGIDWIEDLEYPDPNKPFEHHYLIHWEDEQAQGKEPYLYKVKDGENLTLENSVVENSQRPVKSSALYDKFLTKSDINHKHGQITPDGTIENNTSPNKPLITTTDGVITTGSFSNQANTFSEGNHPHGNISNDGKVGTSANHFVYTGSGGAVTHKSTIGNITTDGKIGTTANKPIITDTGGTLKAGSFGTTANTFAEGNHVHGDITNDGKITSNTVTFSTSDVPIVADNSESGKLQKGYIPSVYVKDSRAYSNIGSSANDTQYALNSLIDTAIGGKLNKSINLNASSTNFVDLDNITSTGFYYLIGNVNCKYVKHKPLDTVNNQSTLADYNAVTTTQNPMNAMSFFLMVEQNYDGSYVKQTWTEYHRDDPRTFIRTKLQDSTGWGEWFEVQMNNVCEVIGTTHSNGSNEWTGKLRKTNKIVYGTLIFLKLGANPPGSDVSLNLTLPNGTTTGAKPIILNDDMNLSNQVPKNSTIALVYNGTKWRVISPVVPSSSNTDIKMNGLSASAGTSNLLARADHIHPSDDSKLDYGADYPSNYIVNSSALSTIGSSANATQQTINTKIDEKLASINTTIVNQGAITVDATLSENSQNPVMSSGLWDEFKSKVDKAVVSGGTNILKGDPVNTGGSSTTGSNYTIESDLYHGNKIYHRDETSYETSKYGDLQWVVLPDEFTYGDVFTLSFYAKGTSGKEIRTYFYGDSNYVNVKRIDSNSTQDSTPSGSWHDGATRFTLTTDWKHYYVTYQLNTTGTLNVNKKLCIRVYGGTDAYISNVQLERGDNVTDYRPNVIAELDNRALTNHTHPYTDLEDPINLDSSSPINYNDYTTVGHYKVWSTTQSHADTLNKPSSDTQGGLLVVEKIPNGYLQILYNYYNASPKIYYRIYHTTLGWRDWQTLSVDGHTHPSTDLKSVPLTATQEAPVDLNNITKTGFYYNNANTQCQYITPLPVKNTAFWLLVEDWASSSYTKQTLTHYPDGGFTYVRIRNGGNWGPWKKIKDETDTPQRYSTEITHTCTVINDYTWLDETYYFNGWSEWDVYGDMKFSDTKKRFEIHKYNDTGLKNFIGIGVSGDTGALTCWWGTSSSAESTYVFKDNDNNYIIPSVNTWYSFRLSRRGKYIIFEFDNKYIYSIEASYFTGFERISPRLFSYKADGTVSCRGVTIQPKQSSMDNLIMCRDIPSNADLNNYIHQSNGYYRCSTSAIAQTLTCGTDSCPTRFAFNMVVYQMGETSNGTAPVRQEIRPYRVNNNDQVIYARNYFNDAWEDWQMYAPVSDDVNDIKMDGSASVGESYTSARSDHIHPTDTSRASSDHTHGSLLNDGTITATTSTVGKVAVTDSSNNLKTIAKVPFANLNISKTNITGLGIASNSVATTSANGLLSSTDKTKLDGITESADSVSFSRSLSTGTKIGTLTINGNATDLYSTNNTTYSAGTGLSLSGTSFSVKYGTASGTACQGNDSRLSDTRDPNPHEHGNITSDGKLSSPNCIAITDSNDMLTVADKLGNITVDGKINVNGTLQTTKNVCTDSSGKITTEAKNNHTHSNYVPISDIQNTLTSTATNKPLSAIQGKELKAMIDNIAHYEISASNYNPHIGDTILLTFTAKDGEGNGFVSSDHLTIKSTEYDGVDKYANYDIEIQTNNNGITTMNLPIIAWGIIDLEWNGTHCQVNSTGWLDVATANNTIPLIGDNTRKWYLMRNETSARLVLNGWASASSSTLSYNPSTNAVSGADTWMAFGGTTNEYKYAKRIRPKNHTVGVNSFATAYFRIQNDGYIKFRSTIGTLPAQSTHYCVIEWTINEEDLYNYNVLFSNGQPYLEY